MNPSTDYLPRAGDQPTEPPWCGGDHHPGETGTHWSDREAHVQLTLMSPVDFGGVIQPADVLMSLAQEPGDDRPRIVLLMPTEGGGRVRYDLAPDEARELAAELREFADLSRTEEEIAAETWRHELEALVAVLTVSPSARARLDEASFVARLTDRVLAEGGPGYTSIDGALTDLLEEMRREAEASPVDYAARVGVHVGRVVGALAAADNGDFSYLVKLDGSASPSVLSSVESGEHPSLAGPYATDADRDLTAEVRPCA